MRELITDEEILSVCKALSSKIRLGIVRHIAGEKVVTLNSLAERFGISGAAVTQNVRILKDAGIVDLRPAPGSNAAKVCVLGENSYVLELAVSAAFDNMYEAEVPVGHYVSYEVFPTCGISTPSALIGEVDDPRYFAMPQRTEAGILWSSRGYFEYLLPNLLKANQRPTEIQISLELSSEAPGVAEKWPSDIYFYFNDTCLGYWTSPGDFGAVPGVYTPDWWFPTWNQYGLLKLLSVNESGSYIDGFQISDHTIHSLALDCTSEFRLRLAVPPDAENVGGVTVFGRGFGNYNQDIRIRVFYETPAAPAKISKEEAV